MSTLLDKTRDQLGELRETSRSLLREDSAVSRRELHDTTAQRLVAADLHIAALQQGDDMRAASARLGEVQQLIEQSLRELRSFAFVLRPAALESRPFDIALRDLVQGFSGRSGLLARADRAWSRGDLPRGARCTLPRGARGAGQHSAPMRPIWWFGLERDDATWLMVTDDGQGELRYPAVDTLQGLGIPGMVRAFAEIGGTLEIVDTGAGTRLQARIPAQDSHANAVSP